MGEIKATVSFTFRDDMGRFLSKIKGGGARASALTVREGVDYAKMITPVGKTMQLRNSIQATAGTSGGTITWGTNHWQYTDQGARPHSIKGNVRFFWEKEGREWNPGPNRINHPGTRAVHYTQKTLDFVRKRYMENLKASI